MHLFLPADRSSIQRHQALQCMHWGWPCCPVAWVDCVTACGRTYCQVVGHPLPHVAVLVL
jgi:hypothetical protein